MKEHSGSSITIAELWRMCITHWRWFVASVTICLIIAIRYIIVTPFLYTRTAAIMLNEENLGENVTEKNSKDFNEIGFVRQKMNVTDVARHITSLEILLEVANRLNPPKTKNENFNLAVDMQSRLTAEVQDIGSAIIDMTYRDYSTIKASRTLELIIQVYNEKWLQEKQKVIRNTSQFIDSRLQLLERELNIVDDSISTYKSRYGITDLQRVSDVYLQQQSRVDAEILRMTNEKAMAEYIRSLLDDKSAQNQLLLVNSGINNSLIESQITLYNSTLLQMQSHMEYTTGQNPLMMNLEKELNSLRKNIYANVTNHIRTIDIQLKSLQNYYGETTSKITSNPSQAKHLISIEREQKVKESLYMYLLQKKEENEISLTYKTAPSQIIDIPKGSGKPTSPKRLRVLFASVLIGALIPFIILFLRASIDESVRNRFDIERSDGILFLGEVPLTRKQSSLLYLKERINRLRKKDINASLVVASGKQDRINEAFRILRTRLEVANNNYPDHHVYMVTSSQSGTGKTFVSMNLALALAITKKRVLFIDGDLRKRSASRIWNSLSHGLADYLDDQVMELDYILFQLEGYPTLDVLPSGTIHTNPTELLNGNKLGELISTMRARYDYILVDTPQADKFADAEIIGKHTDCILSVIHAGEFKRSDLDSLKDEEGTGKKYVILNGVHIGNCYGEKNDKA